jgi:alpha-1,2-mannosyltransferase
MDAMTLPRPAVDHRQRWFVAGLLLFFVGLSVQYSLKVLNHRSAFERWREQILSINDGTDSWERFNYPNPPIMALLLEPLVKLPPLVGALCWFYLKVGMTLLAIHWAFSLVERPGRLFPAWGKALAVLLSLRPIMGDLTHGNVNLFILFLVLGSLYAFRRRRDFTAGIVLALAIACKVTPALFVPYFVWKRAWKTLAGCAVGLVLFFWLVPGSVLGMAENAQYLHSWFERMILPYVVGGEVTTDHNNQSLPGLVHRMLTHSPSFSTYIDNQYTPVEYLNVLDLPPLGARLIVKAAMALFALLVLWTCRTPTTSRRNWRLAAEFSLIVLGMLLFSERTWKHHCVTLLLPFSVLAYYLAAFQPAPRLRWYLIGTLAAVVVLMTTTGTGLVDDLERTAKLAQAYGAYVWAYVLLAAALVVLLRHGEDDVTLRAERAMLHPFYASTSGTTLPPGTSVSGRPVRSVSVVSGSMPSR